MQYTPLFIIAYGRCKRKDVVVRMFVKFGQIYTASSPQLSVIMFPV